MKYPILVLLICTALLQSQSQTTLSGTVGTIKDGSVTLIDILSRDTLAVTVLQDHHFTLQIPTPEGDRVISAAMGVVQHDLKASTMVPVIIDEGNIQINIDSVGQPIYSGSSIQDQFAAFVHTMTEFEMQLAQRASDVVKDSVRNEIGKEVERFYQHHSKTKLKEFASLIVADNILRKYIDPGNLPEISAICEQDLELDAHDQRICDAIARFNESWDNTPVRLFSETLSNGAEFNLNDLVGKKPFIIEFWASWCGPCIKAIPHLKTIYKRYDIEIVGVSTDNSATAWMKSLAKYEMQWPNVRDTKGKISSLYAISAVPTQIVVNSDGIIVARNPEDLEAAIEEALLIKKTGN